MVLPANAVLTLSGDVAPDHGLALAERYFGGLAAQVHPARRVADPLPPTTGVPRDRATGAVPAAQLYLQWRTPARHHPDADAVELALSILGGSETSRLYRRLVRESDLASAAGAGALPLATGNSLGHVFARAHAGVELEQLEDAVLTDIARLAQDGPTPQELHRAKVQFEREWLSEAARLESRADLISAHAMLDDDPGRLNRRVLEMAAVDADAVQNAAATWLRPEDRAALEYRPDPKGTTAP
ncbi:M16 family metallopeptidase [Propioniciclava coleopterorum]|uniref:M16 family metallopeptidase n=1 Tax=Propioniciclava coleopterorum TaxID=2714937 RepID=UPI001FEBEBAF|nr:insulinase family protein [Propioniciclava coleopterorum]